MKRRDAAEPLGVAVKKRVLDALYALRADKMVPGRLRGGGLVFTGHSVRVPSADAFQPNKGLECTPDFLERTLAWLRDEDIPVVTLSEALARQGRGGGPCVAFTFDDGYRDNHQLVLPIFAHHKVPFTVFLTTGFLNRSHVMWWHLIEDVVRGASSVSLRHAGRSLDIPTHTLALKRRAFVLLHDFFLDSPASEREAMALQLAMRHGRPVLERTRNLAMTWDMARQMAASGLAELGCHTISHPKMSLLTETELREEVQGAVAEIKAQTGVAPRFFAYPFGGPAAAGEREFRLVAKLGFDAAFTTRKQVLTPGVLADPFAIPRVSLNGYFQAQRYNKLFLSGLPFLADRLRQSLKTRKGAEAPSPA